MQHITTSLLETGVEPLLARPEEAGASATGVFAALGAGASSDGGWLGSQSHCWAAGGAP